MTDQEPIVTQDNYTDRNYITNLASTGYDFLKTTQTQRWTQPSSALSGIIETADNLDLDAVKFILDTSDRTDDPQAIPVLLKSALKREHVGTYAVDNGTMAELLDMLLQRWEDPEKSEWVNKLPRQLAAHAVARAMDPVSVYDVFRVLEKHGLDLNHSDLYEHTLLHLFSFNSRITKYLIDKGFAPDRKEGRYGHTPLCTLCGYAAKTYREDMYSDIVRSAEFLIQHGAEVNLTAREPIAAYVFGIIREGLEVREGLELETPLHMATRTVMSQPGHLVELLLEHGADPNARNAKDQTMLHICISGKDPETVIRSYVRYGGDVCAMDYKHNTALHLVAEKYGKTPSERMADVYKLLLKYGANPELTNCEGQKPREMCSKMKQKVLKKIEKELSYTAWNMDILSTEIEEFVR